MYKVPHHIDRNRIFIVYRSELEERLDAQYYKKPINILHSIRLFSFAEVKGGKRIPKGYSYSNEATQYYYLRVADMDSDADIKFDTLKCIDEDVFDILKRYEIKEGDLAISIAGTIGKICLLQYIPSNRRVILTENCAKIIVKKNAKLHTRYLKILFIMPFIQHQLQLNYIQTTIPKLGLDRISNLKFPPIPSISFQEQIIQKMDAAYQKKQQKEIEAQKLLNSIEEYLLSELGIILPTVSTDLKSRILFVNRSDLKGRLDPYFSLFFKSNMENLKFDMLNLREVAVICKGEAIKGTDIVCGDIPVIAGGQTSPYSCNISNYSGNVITVSASGAYAGFVWYHDTPIFASDCNVIQSKDESLISTRFIYEVLRVQQNMIYKLQTGAAQSHVYTTDLERLPIPNVPITLQKEIIDNVETLRQQAKELQAEGKTILEETKKEVERMIIGNDYLD